MKKRILIPLIFDYYNFDFFRFLIPRLLDDGFAVSVYTMDRTVMRKFTFDHVDYEVRGFPAAARFIYGRSGNPFLRVLLWLISWSYAARFRRRFDFAILPWDNMPFWYAIACRVPSMTIHNTTFMNNIQDVLDKQLLRKDGLPRFHRLFSLVDRFCKGGFFMRMSGQVVRYTPLLAIDRLMGFRGRNLLLGESPVKFFSVTGHRISENYVSLGFDPSRIKVVGNPAYDRVFDTVSKFGADERQRFAMDTGLPDRATIFTMFLSPSSFTRDQIDEVVDVAAAVKRTISGNPFLVIKFHPKTKEKFPGVFAQRLAGLGIPFKLITAFTGEEFNIRLVAVSDYVVQKQSTVGFIAMIMKKKVISYNLRRTDYEDSMYKVIGGSAHAESVSELESVLENAGNVQFWQEIAARQEKACHNFCLATDQAGASISRLIRNYVEHGHERK